MAHISHLHEDRELTLRDIESMATMFAMGMSCDATEKLDGANLMYTCTSKFEVRAARSEGDIKAGGLHASVLEAKFTGRGLVQDTFVKGFSALRTALLNLTMREANDVFDNGQRWYSAEILYTGNPNVVSYRHNAIVLHEHPQLTCRTGVVTGLEGKGFSILEKLIPELDKDVSRTGWRIYGPRRLTFKLVSDPRALPTLLAVVKKMGSPDTTLENFLYGRALDVLEKYKMSEPLLMDAAKRLAEVKGAPTLTVLRSRVPSQVAMMLRSSDEWVTKQLAPLELAVVDFGVALLADLTSTLVDDPAAEASRIRAKLEESLQLVKKSRNQYAIDYVAAQMTKLKDPARVTTPVEGIVFSWKGKLYKLTGVFASANAIIGLCRYGRGRNIPPIV